MRKQTGRAAAELCGAVIGAGFASGREIAAFFARFGPWSWLGVAAAAAVMGCMTYGVMRTPGRAGMPDTWQGSWLGRLWQGMFVSLMAVTGGAMLAGGGEIAALMLPIHGARVIGLGASVTAAWLLAGRESRWLAAVSKGLIACLVLVVLAGLFLPVEPAASLGEGGDALQSLLHGLCYGGFNVALASPVIGMTGSGMAAREQKRCAAVFTAIVAGLMACGNLVLLRHPALQGENLPFVRLTAALGKAGYALGGAALYLAALTTLTACLRGLHALAPQGKLLTLTAVLLLSLGGLERIVGVAYPVLGGCCFLLLGAAQLQNGTKT